MQALIKHNEERDLLKISRLESGRVSHRVLAIRDIVQGRSRGWVCEQYGISRETLRHWVSRYNALGIEGLYDKERSGRPAMLSDEELVALKQRISVAPDFEKDGITRWRSVDIQRILREEYDVHYRSLFGVRQLLHRLGLSRISGRPSHPNKPDNALQEFKKNS